MKKVLAALFLLIFTSSLFAQFERDTSIFMLMPFRNRLVTAGTDKQLNTFNFVSQLKQFYNTPNLFFGINENFISTIIRSADYNIKDEHYLSAIAEYQFSSLAKFGFLFNNNAYSDDRKTAINKASILNFSGYTRISPSNNLQLIPYFGLSNNTQIGESDNGFIYGTDALMSDLQLDDFDFNSSFRFQNEDISPRKNLFRYFNVNMLNKIDENFSNIISGYFYQQRKDFYFAADTVTANEFSITNNIQSRIETNYYLQNRTNFALPDSNFAFDLLGKISWRNIDRNTRYISLKNITPNIFDTRINEFKIELNGGAEYKTENFNSIAKISFLERDEKHIPKMIEGANPFIYSESEANEIQKNYTSLLTTVSITANYKISSKDLLSFSIFHRKLRYDTPSELNYDDRDELLSIAGIVYQRKLSSFFTAFINIEGSINKIVYIFSQRSSNNNVKRILKLSSGGKYNGSKFTSSNTAEVSANYTVFDYEDLNPNFKSFSFRQFVFRDSTSFLFARNLRLFITGYIKLSEQGDFKWQSFSSRPIRYLSESYAEPKIFYEYQKISFGAGVRYFSLATFNYNNQLQKVQLSDYVSIGPVSEISIDLYQRLNLKFYGWYEFIRTENNDHRELANMTFRLQWQL